MNEKTSVEKVFKDRFDNKAWGKGESISGSGSSLAKTRRIANELPKVLAHFQIRSLLDIPCGDFHWFRTVDLTGVDYIGADIVPDLICHNKQYERPGVRFDTLDILTSQLPSVDLIFTRDCLVHLSNEQIVTALRNIKRSGAKWFMATTFPGCEVNHNISPGAWRRINMEEKPFNLPVPDRYIFEYCTELENRCRDKSLGLWKTESIYI